MSDRPDAVRIGTRGSRLALWQAERVKVLLAEAHPGLEVEVRVIRTRGDRDRNVSLTAGAGIGFFTKEIEEALLTGEVDVAVHSLKDLPTTLAPGLVLAGVPERADVRDALIGRTGRVDGLADLGPGITLGTSSPRRCGQLLGRHPGLTVVPIRGNVPTRLDSVERKDGPDATILALAGLERLGLEDRITEAIPLTEMLPAAGQGAIGIEAREDDGRVRGLVAAIEDAWVREAVDTERAFLRRLQGGCSVPAGVLAATREERTIQVHGVVADPGGDGIVEASRTGRGAEGTGIALAEELLSKGADRILARIREEGA